MINWKVRFKNKSFWLGLIGVIGTLVVQLAQLFGFDVSALASEWQQALVGVVTAVFGVLTVAGIIVDPTTAGMSDSNQALGYTEPKAKGK